MATDRCPRCDREDCPTRRWGFYPSAPQVCGDTPIRSALRNCRKHAVDWRARALAAEAALAEVSESAREVHDAFSVSADRRWWPVDPSALHRLRALIARHAPTKEPAR